ncbi:MAG: hypothetical protein VKS61_17770 [Candidatus Sericytochromatia bacterium]|nr:hypothetical protein [Candidatus Sericytochromatia bacterium]
MMRLGLATVVTALALGSGCAANSGWADAPIVAPSRSVERPAVAELPRPDAYIDALERWRRETRLGIGGHVEGVLRDPALAAAEVSHQAAVDSLGKAATADLLAHRWPVLFGPLGDRFPIDLSWRFDEQFISSRRVLDPVSWRFALETSEGLRLEPLAAAVLQAASTTRDGMWWGEVRLWFPWRHPDTRVPVLAGGARWARLTLAHTSGTGELSWRFRGAW